jgi:diguanylate cyclase (GGDEF)-like protein
LDVIEIDGERHILQMSHDISEIKAAQEQLRIESRTDPLTLLPNRRHFQTLAELEVQRSIRHRSSLSLILCDIDHFKKVNDGHGHQAGDRVLVEFAEVLRKETRTIDVLGRLGGEEFLVLLPDEDLDSAVVVAERIRKRVESTPVVFEGTQIWITCSLGVSSFSDGDGLDQLIARADTALYRAKASGRNRVTSQ